MHLLVIENKNGVNCSVHRTPEGADRAIEAYMDSYPDDAWWPEDFQKAEDLDDKIVAYFSDNDHESYILKDVQLED